MIIHGPYLPPGGGVCAAGHLSGHDAALFANAGIPAAMIFVRNQHGSHNPEEDMRIDDLMAGATVLYEAIFAVP